MKKEKIGQPDHPVDHFKEIERAKTEPYFRHRDQVEPVEKEHFPSIYMHYLNLDKEMQELYLFLLQHQNEEGEDFVVEGGKKIKKGFDFIVFEKAKYELSTINREELSNYMIRFNCHDWYIIGGKPSI